MADKLYMKDAQTIIMSCFSAGEQDEDRQTMEEEWKKSKSGGITVH